jgi:hypothetical protein
MVMLDPGDYDDVIVTVAHPWGDIEAPLGPSFRRP